MPNLRLIQVSALQRSLRPEVPDLHLFFRHEGIQTPEFESVRRGREPGAKGKGRVKGSTFQSLDLSKEGVSQEPERGEGKG